MARDIFNKFLGNLIPVDVEENDEDEVENVEEENEEENSNRGFFSSRIKKVVNMPQSQHVKMVISQPTTFEQAEEICTYLKNKESVIVNLEYVNKDVGRRIVDFMCGAAYGLDGHMEKISNSIFLFAPTYYEISTEKARDEIKNKLSVSWLKNG